MKKRFDVISPVDGSTYLSIEEANPGQIARTLDKAATATQLWRQSTVSERVDAVDEPFRVQPAERGRANTQRMSTVR